MGIPGLWDVLGDGELRSLAELSTEHYQKHQRPLRIAVDEASWRFKNLNPFQVQLIREKEPAANPVEKAILFRILKLRKLNVQLLFVFDGDQRPWKKGRPSGRVDYKQTDLLQKVLNNLRIPHHRAPGEAEAECARLQQLGIVDAVWSEDGDTLMFGCNVLFRNHKVGNKKSDTHVRVYRADQIRQKLGLDRPALVLFALTNGCDYTKGLQRCGPKLALKAAQYDGAMLGKSLCMATNNWELHAWRLDAALFFAPAGVHVPPEFPDPKALKYCNTPTVTSEGELRDLRGLRSGWERNLAQDSLRTFLRDRFNFSTKGYLKHIAPLILVQKITSESSFGNTNRSRNPYNITINNTRRGQSHDLQLERKIKFDPTTVIPFDLSRQPPEEDWSLLGTEKEPWLNAKAMVECEILDYLLRQSLPEDLLQPAPPKKSAAKRKRKDDATGEDSCQTPKSQKRTQANQANAKHSATASDGTPSRIPTNVSQLHTTSQTPAISNSAIIVDLFEDDDDDLPGVLDLLNTPTESRTRGLHLDDKMQKVNQIITPSKTTYCSASSHSNGRKENQQTDGGTIALVPGCNFFDLT